MSDTKTQLRKSFAAWAETQVELLEAVATEISVENYDGAATALERATKGMATLAVATRNEAIRKAAAGV